MPSAASMARRNPADERVAAYRAGQSVSSPDSKTPTYVAIALQIDNWRCAVVPFY